MQQVRVVQKSFHAVCFGIDLICQAAIATQLIFAHSTHQLVTFVASTDPVIALQPQKNHG